MTVSSPSRGRLTRPTLFGIGVLLSYQLAWTAGIIPITSFPSLTQLGSSLGTELSGTSLWRHVWGTCWIWLSGLAIGAVLGVVGGLVIGANSVLQRLTQPTIDAVRPVPMIMLLPVAILLLGMGPKLGLVLVAFSVFWPMVIHTIYGVTGVDAVAGDVSRVLQLGRVRTLSFITIPAALPLIFTGLKVAAATGLVVQVGVALIVGGDGMGGAIAAAQIAGAIPEMYLYVLLTGLLAVAVMGGLTRVERRLVFYSPAHRKVAA